MNNHWCYKAKLQNIVNLKYLLKINSVEKKSDYYLRDENDCSSSFIFVYLSISISTDFDKISMKKIGERSIIKLKKQRHRLF